MIIDQSSLSLIYEELDPFIKKQHQSSHTKVWTEKYTGNMILSPDFITDLKENERKELYVEALVPDVQTRQLCKKIHNYLTQSRSPHDHSHGFERDRNVMTFITPHKSNRRLLTIRLENVFERLGKRKIKAMFIRLFQFDAEKADYLANLVTSRGRLAQGNPLAPQIFNIMAYKTDQYLSQFCFKYKLTYTRFVDEFIFSSPHYLQTEVISKIKRIISRCGWIIDNEFVDIQSGNHFRIAGHIIDHKTGEIKTKDEKSKKLLSNHQHSNNEHPQETTIRRAAHAFQRFTNPSDQIKEEKSLIRSLRKTQEND